MATYIKKPNGWMARVRKQGVSKSAMFTTKAAAQAWATKTELEIMEHKHGVVPSDKTFADLLRRYLAEESVKKKGERWERVRIEYVLKTYAIASVKVDELAPSHFSDWRNERLKEVSPATVNRDWNLLSAVCSVAVKEWGWLRENPMSRVRRPKSPPPRTRRFEEGELERLLVALGYAEGKAPATVGQRVAYALLFALETAMRSGEICNMDWGHVDLKKRTVFIPDSKTGMERTVPLSNEAAKLLTSLGGGDGSVFGITPASRDAVFRKAKARAGIEGLVFHDSRAEALTRLAKKLDVLKLAKVSGHRDLNMLLNTYYRERAEDYVALLD